jgi:hypothetical protein
MSASSDYLRVVTDIQQQKGATAAATQRTNAQIWGNSIAKLGEFAGEAVQQLAVDKKAKRQEQEDQKLRDLFETASQEFEQSQQPSAQIPALTGSVDGQATAPPGPARTLRQSPIPTSQELIRTIGPTKAIPIINALAAMKTDPAGDPEKSLKMLQAVAKGLNALPEDMRAKAYPALVENFEQRGIIKPGTLQKEYSPEYWKFITGTGTDPKDAALVPIPGPDGKPVYGTAQPGQPVYEKPAGGGGLVPIPGPDGKPVYGTPTPGAPVYEKPGADGGRNPTEWSLIEAAAKGDKDAAAALALYRRQHPIAAGGGGALQLVPIVGPDGKSVLVREQDAIGKTPASAIRSTGDTAQDRQRNARTQAARGFLARLNELRTKINTKMGPEAGLTGMVRRAKAGVGMDPDVAEYERERAAGGRALAVAIMGAQNLSDADAKAWADMLPGATVDKDTAQRLMTQIETMLNEMNAENPMATGTATPPAAPAAPAAPKKNPFR